MFYSLKHMSEWLGASILGQPRVVRTPGIASLVGFEHGEMEQRDVGGM